jgi:hypothetical protein
MVTHVKLIGILHILMGAFGILVGLGLLILFGGIASIVGFSDHTRDSLVAIPIIGSIGVFIFIFIAVLSLPDIAAGIGLLQFKPWARTLAIILSALHLFNVPFGTALGVYGLWALLRPETEALFERGPMAAVPRY